ncbi:MAG: hypothetical protein EAZ91_04735 [Cytophagales bacterium]|nr:MAG: hypothetical protein EAZ91_04735 [Cytophagales bacterium]
MGLCQYLSYLFSIDMPPRWGYLTKPIYSQGPYRLEYRPFIFILKAIVPSQVAIYQVVVF